MGTEKIALPLGKWVIDPVHPAITFSVRHLIAARARGRFNNFEGFFIVKDPIEDSYIQVEIDAKSIDTNQEMRDNHVRSADFSMLKITQNHICLKFSKGFI